MTTKKQPAKLVEGLFNVGQHVVYPAHGVGRVTGVETQQVAGMKLEVFVVAAPLLAEEGSVEVLRVLVAELPPAERPRRGRGRGRREW